MTDTVMSYWPSRFAICSGCCRIMQARDGRSRRRRRSLATILPEPGLIQTRATASLRCRWRSAALSRRASGRAGLGGGLGVLAQIGEAEGRRGIELSRSCC